MKLKQMLVGLEGLKVKGDLEIDIKGIEKNSKEVKSLPTGVDYEKER
jgi:hypothetical protein